MRSRPRIAHRKSKSPRPYPALPGTGAAIHLSRSDSVGDCYSQFSQSFRMKRTRPMKSDSRAMTV